MQTLGPASASIHSRDTVSKASGMGGNARCKWHALEVLHRSPVNATKAGSHANFVDASMDAFTLTGMEGHMWRYQWASSWAAVRGRHSNRARVKPSCWQTRFEWHVGLLLHRLIPHLMKVCEYAHELLMQHGMQLAIQTLGIQLA